MSSNRAFTIDRAATTEPSSAAIEPHLVHVIDYSPSSLELSDQPNLVVAFLELFDQPDLIAARVPCRHPEIPLVIVAVSRHRARLRRVHRRYSITYRARRRLGFYI